MKISVTVSVSRRIRADSRRQAQPPEMRLNTAASVMFIRTAGGNNVFKFINK